MFKHFLLCVEICVDFQIVSGARSPWSYYLLPQSTTTRHLFEIMIAVWQIVAMLHDAICANNDNFSSTEWNSTYSDWIIANCTCQPHCIEMQVVTIGLGCFTFFTVRNWMDFLVPTTSPRSHVGNERVTGIFHSTLLYRPCSCSQPTANLRNCKYFKLQCCFLAHAAARKMTIQTEASYKFSYLLAYLLTYCT